MTTDDQPETTVIRPPAKRQRRRLLLGVSLVAFLTLVFIVGKQIFDHYVTRRIEGEIAAVLPKIEARTGLRVGLKSVAVGLDGNIVLHRPTLTDADAPGAAPFFTAGKIEIDYALDRANKTVTVRGIHLLSPEWRLTLTPAGDVDLPPALLNLWGDHPEKATVAEPPTPALPDRVRLAESLNVTYSDGRLVFADRGRLSNKPLTLLDLNRGGGAISLTPATRQGQLVGQAKNAAGTGGLKYEIVLAGGAPEARLTFDGFSLESLAPLAPFGLQIEEGTRLDGPLTIRQAPDGRVWRLDTDVRVNDLGMNHPRLASQPVRGMSLGCRGELHIDRQNRLFTTPEMVLHIGQAPIRLREVALATADERGPSLQAKIDFDRVRLQDLLDGLPETLIPVVKGSLVEGALDLHGSLVLDLNKPERSGLELEGGVVDFRAVFVPPRCDVRQIAQPDFKHLARKRGLLKKTIVVGPSNPDFVPFADTGSYLRGAVLTCEDGSFMRHNGFMLRHINDSLRRDLRERRFVRGASTISMQLTKNLFLSEEKTISRKLQEMMLTWWLEHSIEKERLFEVYLNIIEWGPDIYGIGPASSHYFHRPPSRLLPIQAAFLASVIMNPVRFYYMKARGQVTDGWRINLAFILEKMRQRGTITQEDYDLTAAHNFDVPFGAVDWNEPPAEPAADAEKPAAAPIPEPLPDQTDMLELKEDGSGLDKTPE